ncbi:hypothetical protein [Lewinella cohaerens]|uniref:hypothetical protein n=1 Tax=Lewinella cohaerens TaxID=70995 RepID=UPI000376045B|nr:hypothetical protein [Lewinella cohaerens]
MRKNKALTVGYLLLLFPLLLFSQEQMEIEFSEGYMNIQQPIGYVIHALDGTVIQYAKFDRQSLKKGVKVLLNSTSTDSLAITIVFEKSNYSYFPLSENLIFDRQQIKTSNSLNLASAGYTVDFSSVVSTNVELGDWQPSRSTTSHVTKTISLSYNFLHPLFIPYNFDSDNGYQYYTHPSLARDRIDFRLVAQNDEIASSSNFLDIELSDSIYWKSDILLFSKTYDQPYLLYGETLKGILTMSVPVPEALDIYKIGLITEARNVKIYTEFDDLESHLIQDNNVENPNIDHKVQPTACNIPANDIALFQLMYGYDKPDGATCAWVIIAKTPSGIQFVMPEIPEEITGSAEMNEIWKSPRSARFYVYVASDTVDTSLATDSDFFDLYWKLKHGISVYSFRYDW